MSASEIICPICEEIIQVPNGVKETFCAGCGNKINVKNAASHRASDNIISIGDLNAQLANSRKLRDRELKDFFKTSQYTSLYQQWELPHTYNAQIEQMDPTDVLTKELRICEEFRSLLNNTCSDKGVFCPAGITFFGNKVSVNSEGEIIAKQHFQKINKDAEAILLSFPKFDFSTTQKLIIDLINLDKTNNLYSLFFNGLEIALIALKHYYIPVIKKNVQAPLGDRLADCMVYIVQLITSRLDEEQLQYIEKTKILDLKKLLLLK